MEQIHSGFKKDVTGKTKSARNFIHTLIRFNFIHTLIRFNTLNINAGVAKLFSPCAKIFRQTNIHFKMRQTNISLFSLHTNV